VAGCVLVARLSHVGTAFLVLLAIAFATYVAGYWLLRHGGSFGPVFAVACAIQLAPLAAPLLLSTDALTYWSYARLHDPYLQTPADDPVSAAHVGAFHLHATSANGPAFTLVSKPVALTRSPAVAGWSFRIAAALAVLVATFLASRRRAAAAALVGWNPVVAVHFAGGGHNDALMAALVAAALALGDRGRPRPAGVAWALAVLVKWVPLVLLPLRALEARAKGRRVDHVAFAVTAVVTLALATVLWGLHWLHAFAPLALGVEGRTSYALPSRLHAPTWVFVAAYAVAYVWLLFQAARGWARLGLAWVLLLLCLPYLIVWYVLWPLVASAYDEDRAAVLLTLALCAYLLPQTIT
jgi:hypothetical protein